MVSLTPTAAVLIGMLAQSANQSDAMQAARHALQHHHGHTLVTTLSAERLEYHHSGSELVADVAGWVGGDLHKFGLTLEAEHDFDEHRTEELELQALYRRGISAFWDLQAGLRHDVRPKPGRTYATIGLRGLAPYWIEMDAAAFLSDAGDVSVRLEAEYDMRFTQRWLLQSRLEANIGAGKDRDLNVGKGLRDLEWGLRLRFEVTPQFAPYIGFEQSRAFGATATARRASDQSRRESRWIAGVRFWL